MLADVERSTTQLGAEAVRTFFESTIPISSPLYLAK